MQFPLASSWVGLEEHPIYCLRGSKRALSMLFVKPKRPAAIFLKRKHARNRKIVLEHLKFSRCIEDTMVLFVFVLGTRMVFFFLIEGFSFGIATFLPLKFVQQIVYIGKQSGVKN